jgi:hypothetical protein
MNGSVSPAFPKPLGRYLQARRERGRERHKELKIRVLRDSDNEIRKKKFINTKKKKKEVIVLSVFMLIYGSCVPKTTSTNLSTTFPQTDMLNIQQQEETILKKNEVNPIQVLNAEKIISEAPKIGLKTLEKIIYPITLVYLDTSFRTTLIELEFQSAFLEKHYSNKVLLI